MYAAAKKWEAAADVAKAISELVPDAPFGWVHLACALHELNRTRESWAVLITVVDKFPDEYIIRNNLSCYACQLGNRKEAWQWLERTIEIADTKDVKLMALDDPNLERLWSDIAEI